MSDVLDNWGRDRPPAAPGKPTVSAQQKLQIAAITAAALAFYIGMRLLPTGTNLNHMDFRVTDKNAIEFCDPANPQFIPVIAARSPVTMTLASDAPPAKGKTSRLTLTLRTAGGKPIGPAELLVAHTQKLHLLIVDPTLTDYQHIHPEPGRRAGDWEFDFKPEGPGAYRVFADFTPVVTQRGLYAAADFSVPGEVANVSRVANTTLQAGTLSYELVLPRRFRAGAPADLVLRIQRVGAEPKPVKLEPIMDAFAHLVAFDEQRSGFAHLHPQQTDLAQPPDPLKPELKFKVTIPQPGRYVIWAQLKISGDPVFIPFWVDVLPGGSDATPDLPLENSTEPKDGKKGKDKFNRNVSVS